MWTKKFWLDTAERVISTAAQSAAASIGTTALIQGVDWRVVGGTTAVAALLSLLKALYASRKGDGTSASLVS
jgi:r1t holin